MIIFCHIKRKQGSIRFTYVCKTCIQRIFKLGKGHFLTLNIIFIFYFLVNLRRRCYSFSNQFARNTDTLFIKCNVLIRFNYIRDIASSGRIIQLG